MKQPLPITSRTIAAVKVARQKCLEAFHACQRVTHELADEDAKGDLVTVINRIQASANATAQAGMAAEAMAALRKELEPDMLS